MSPITHVSEPEFSSRPSRSWALLAWMGGTIAAAVILAVLFVLGYARYTSYQQERAALLQVVQLLNYNLSVGKLAPVPAPPPVVAAPTPAEEPEAAKKNSR